MADLTTVVDSYLTAYGEPDPSHRRRLIEQSWSVEGTLTDPPLAASGHDGIDAMFAAVQGQFPGHTFRRSTDVDHHHAVARYGWDLVSADGSVALAGVDFAEFGDDGRLVRVVGFFGPLAVGDA